MFKQLLFLRGAVKKFVELGMLLCRTVLNLVSFESLFLQNITAKILDFCIPVYGQDTLQRKPTSMNSQVLPEVNTGSSWKFLRTVVKTQMKFNNVQLL